MPRIRNILPDFPTLDRMPEVPREARYLKLLLMTVADDEGRFVFDPEKLCKTLYPDDWDAPMSIRSWFGQLVYVGAAERYSVDGVEHGRPVRWHDEQTICHPKPSVLPSSPTEPPREPGISRSSGKTGRQLAKAQEDQALGGRSEAILENDIFSADPTDASALIDTIRRIGNRAAASDSPHAALRAAELLYKLGALRPRVETAKGSTDAVGRSPDEIMMEARQDGHEGLMAPHEVFGLPSEKPSS